VDNLLLAEYKIVLKIDELSFHVLVLLIHFHPLLILVLYPTSELFRLLIIDIFAHGTLVHLVTYASCLKLSFTAPIFAFSHFPFCKSSRVFLPTPVKLVCPLSVQGFDFLAYVTLTIGIIDDSDSVCALSLGFPNIDVDVVIFVAAVLFQ